jgi:hypothetical protein
MKTYFDDFVSRHNLNDDEKYALIGFLEYHTNDYFNLAENILVILKVDVSVDEVEKISKSFFEQYSKN